MYNAANKIIRPVLAGMALLTLLASCGPSAEERAAAELLGHAEALYDLKEYQAAVDSVKALNERYRGLTDIRRSALRVQALATEGLIKDSIEAIEPVLAQSTISSDSLKALFTFVEPSAEGIDGYFIPTAAKGQNAMNATGIQPRVSTEGYLYLAANITGRITGLNSLSISSGQDIWTSGTISPTRVLDVEGSEIASISPEEIAGLGQWLKSHPATGLKGIFTGSKGKAQFAIKPAMRENLVLCYDYSEALQLHRHASIQREKLERKLQAVRESLANLPLPSQD